MAKEDKQHQRGIQPRTAKKDPDLETGWRAPAIFDSCGPLDLESLFALRPEAWLRRVEGRETFLWPAREHWVVKRTVGGEAREYWYERLRGAARAPARRELENLLALAQQGFPVPEGLAWCAEPAAAKHPRRAGRSALVMARVEHSGSLRERLKVVAELERGMLLGQLLALVTRLHAAGWIHRDLYLQHFVCVQQGLLLLDVGRARQRPAPRSRWFVKDLAALHFSAPASVSRSERLRFLKAWLQARGQLEPNLLRKWVERITRRGRRMGSHRPRQLDPGDPLDAELFP
jgi:tRNA A-37 threonylcarbamoyl transferase component Bud32